MAREKRNNKIHSSRSDESLARLIAEDMKRVPSEFSVSKNSGISNSQGFLHNTSARGIKPMLKWL